MLKALNDKRLAAQALVETENGMTGQLGVAAALELSWQELNEAEQELACVLGMFAIAPIPWSLVEICQPEVNPEDLEDIRDDGLMAHSLLKRVGDSSYQLHQIVQEYFRIKLSERGVGEASQNENRGQSIKIGFWKGIKKVCEINDPATRYQIQRFKNVIPHVDEAMEVWISSLEDKDLMLPFLGIGRFYKSQWDFDSAEIWYCKCLENTKKRLGTEHENVAKSMNNLAEVYLEKRRYDEAEPLFRSSLNMFQRIYDQDNMIVAVALDNLASLYRYMEKYENAEELNKQSLDMLVRLFGEGDEYVAVALDNRGLIFKEQGKYEEAKLLYLKSLNIFQGLPFSVDQSEAYCLIKLAKLYIDQDNLKDAEHYFRRALRILISLHENQHPLIAECMWELGIVLQHQGMTIEAERLYEQALEISDAEMGINGIIWRPIQP